MQLWQEYAMRVNEFEPTKRWEEAALALCLIQAVRWKNQLFNYHLATSATPADKPDMPDVPVFFAKRRSEEEPAKTDDAAKHKATRLRFPDKA